MIAILDFRGKFAVMNNHVLTYDCDDLAAGFIPIDSVKTLANSDIISADPRICPSYGIDIASYIFNQVNSNWFTLLPFGENAIKLKGYNCTFYYDFETYKIPDPNPPHSLAWGIRYRGDCLNLIYVPRVSASFEDVAYTTMDILFAFSFRDYMFVKVNLDVRYIDFTPNLTSLGSSFCTFYLIFSSRDMEYLGCLLDSTNLNVDYKLGTPIPQELSSKLSLFWGLDMRPLR